MTADQLTTPASAQIVRIDAMKSWPVDPRDLWHYRELVFFLIWRDVKVRYRQTILGALWVILQPLLTMLIFTFFFGKLSRVPSSGIPYPLFAYSTLLLWTLFSRGVTAAGFSLIGNTNLITKIYFPRWIIPAAVVAALLVDFVIGGILLVPLLIKLRVMPSPLSPLVIPLIVLLLIFTLAVGLLAASLSVRYRDVGQALPFFVQLGMFASPVIYPASIVPPKYKLLFNLNPLTGIFETFRALFFGTIPIPWVSLSIACMMTAVITVISVIVFQRLERSFADVI